MRRHSHGSSAAAANGTGNPAGRLYRRTGVVLAATALTLLALLAPAASAASRAYELVSPANKGGDEVGDTPNGGSFITPTTSPDGKRVVFSSTDAYPGSEGNLLIDYYLAERGAAEWKTSFLTPPSNPVFGIGATFFGGYAEDLRYGAILWQGKPPLTADAPAGTPVMYRRNFLTGEYTDIVPGLPAHEPGVAVEFAGASKDFSKIVMLITGGGLLTPETPGAGVVPLLYEWSAATGQLTLVGHLPNNSVPNTFDGIARPPGTVGVASGEPFNPVSDDGSRVFFTLSAEGTEQLYVRIDGTTTQQVSASQASAPDPKGPKDAFFRRASADGSVAFFTSSAKLTDDATTGPNDEGSDLHRYVVAPKALTDLTVDGAETAGARVQGVLGGAEDGSDLYFVAKGVLAPGATAGENNLYLWSDDGTPHGSVKFIATGLDPANWTNLTVPFESRVPSRVTPDGKHLLFESTVSYTGYPNAGHYEAFLYDAETGNLVCATCNPSGAPATADAMAVGTGDYSWRARTLSDDGTHVFFYTTERLVAGDNNAVDDTYEYDAASGRINLISSGKAEIPSPFSDATANGSDVYFTTRQRLVGIDTDENVDIYDARVGGGLAAQNPPASPFPCMGQECRGEAAAVPVAPRPASSTLNGPGNQKQRKHRKHRGKKKHRRATSHANRNGNH